MLALFAAAVLYVPSTGLPKDASEEIARLEKRVAETEEGRRLLAEAAKVPRRAAELKGESVVFRHGPPAELVFDVKAMGKATESEFVLAYGRELARAAVGAPASVTEGELAAARRSLLFAIDLARTDKELSKRLKEIARVPAHDPEPLPRRGELGRAARGLALASVDPVAFYDWVERSLPEDANRFPLEELEDYAARRPLKRATGRRRRRALAAAAAALVENGGLPRAKEAVGDLDGTDAAELKRRAGKWLNSSR